MSVYDNWRLNYGLRWRTARPELPWKHLSAVALLVLLCVLAGSLDYAIARAEHAERAAELYEAKARVLHDCERGATGYYYPDGRTYECSKRL